MQRQAVASCGPCCPCGMQLIIFVIFVFLTYFVRAVEFRCSFQPSNDAVADAELTRVHHGSSSRCWCCCHGCSWTVHATARPGDHGWPRWTDHLAYHDWQHDLPSHPWSPPHSESLFFSVFPFCFEISNHRVTRCCRSSRSSAQFCELSRSTRTVGELCASLPPQHFSCYHCVLPVLVHSLPSHKFRSL